MQWQEAQARAAETQGWSFSFVKAFKEAAVYASREAAGMSAKEFLLIYSLAGGFL
jgi:hypothetical protein